MRKILTLLLVAALCLTLAGCLGNGSVRNPETVADGTPWNDAWATLGGRIGIEQPGEPFVLLDTNGNLPSMEMYYCSWVCGEQIQLGEDDAYEGQIYLLAEECGDAATAKDTMLLWREQMGDDFLITQERTFEAQGVEFTLTFYDYAAEDTHFVRGVTAMGVWKDMGILVDAAHTAEYALDLSAIMEKFLTGFHYAQ